MNLVLLLLMLGMGLKPVAGYFLPPLGQNPNLIQLRTREIDTRCLPLLSLKDNSAAQRFIVHFDHPITADDQVLLESNGLKIESYLPNYAFLVYGSCKKAAELHSEGSIDWFGEYLPQDKIDPVLFTKEERTKLEVMLFPDVEPREIQPLLLGLGAQIESESSNEHNGKLIIWLAPSMFLEAAKLDGVRWIEPWYDVELLNDQTQWVTQTWKAHNRRIWDMGLNGEGVIGSICDVGINPDHVMFADSSITIATWGDYPEHRKIIAYKPTTSAVEFGDKGGIVYYHGSHTAGTVAGEDSYWGKASPFDGMAPRSRLYVLDFDGYLYGITPDYRDMYQIPYGGNSAGRAKFISNSWGEGIGYTSHAWESDQFMWEHPDFLICFAAGNNYTILNSPGTAKNMLTVGATVNGAGATVPADFSSSGPAPDGRVKPDVMAPGVNLMSALGSSTDQYQPLTGTSMACPAAAGSVALLTQYLREGWYPTGGPEFNQTDSIEPSAALLKAMLITSTIADFPSYAIPNFKIGWGRICLDSVLYFAGDERKLYLYDDKEGLSTADVISFEVAVKSSDWPLRAVLVWTDAPPELSAAKQLVNNLDLEVYNPSGQLYRGNNFQENYSVPDGAADALNVVEMVRVQNPTSGTWSVRVKASNIPEGPQPYALVITGDLEYHDVNLASSSLRIDDSQTVPPNGALDSGEAAVLYPVVTNIGSYHAKEVTGTLSTESEKIEIVDATSDYGNIVAGKSSDGNGFPVVASQALTEGEKVFFQLNLEANDGSYVRTLEYSLISGLGINEETTLSYSLEITANPFNKHILVCFTLPRTEPVRLQMYDQTGRLVRTLLSESALPAGSREYTFGAFDEKGLPLANGVYFVRLVTPQKTMTCKGLRLE